MSRRPTLGSSSSTTDSLPMPTANVRTAVHHHANTPYKITLVLITACLATALGSSFTYGYNIGVLNVPNEVLLKRVNDTYYDRQGHYFKNTQLHLLWSLAVSIFCLGGLTGSLFGGKLTRDFGRKRTLAINNIIGILGSGLEACFFSSRLHYFELFIAGRFLVGVNAGVNTTAAPLYLSEIAPRRIRGQLGVTFQMSVVTGVFVSQLLGFSQFLGSKDLCIWLFVIPLLINCAQACVLFICPESPKYLLLIAKDPMAARESLRVIRGVQDVSEELAEIDDEEVSAGQSSQISIRRFFEKRHLRLLLLIAVGIHVSQQLCGINAINFYSEIILKTAGIQETKSQYYATGLSFLYIPLTITSIFLIESLGRKMLYAFGLLGVGICSVVICIALKLKMTVLILTSLVLFVLFFSLGPGPIPWIIVPEMFSSNARSTAVSVAVATNWLATFLVGLLFPLIDDLIGYWVFLIFAAFSSIFALFTFLFVPETRGRTSDEIAHAFMQPTQHTDVDPLF